MRFQGREEELNILKNWINQYKETPVKSCLLDVYAESGKGKTALVRHFYDEMKEQEKNELINIEYIDATDCSSFDKILLKLRFNYKNSEEEFKKFDLMYILFYDFEFYFSYLKRLKINEKEGKGENKSCIQKLDKESVTEILQNILEFGLKVAAQNEMFSLANYIDIRKIGVWLKEKKKEEQTKELLKKIRKYYEEWKEKEEYGRIQALIQYFLEGVERQRKNIFIVDNYGNKGDALGEFIFGKDGVVTLSSKVCWIFCSHKQVKLKDKSIKAEYLKLEGLRESTVNNIIEECKGFEKLKRENQMKLKTIICDKTKESPFKLSVYIQTLEKKIRIEEEKNPNAGEYEIDPQYFEKTFPEEEKALRELAYYFETDKSEQEKEFFYLLSCKEVWNEYFYTLIKDKMPCYFEKSKSWIEKEASVDLLDSGLKLHDSIRESLYESYNNRIKYDVVNIIYEDFLESVYKTHKYALENLWGYLDAVKKLCEFDIEKNGTYEDKKQIWAEFLKKFWQIIKQEREKSVVIIDTPEFAAFYSEIVTEYKKVLEKNDSEYGKLLHEYGLYLYESDRIKEAEKVDKEHFKIIEQCETTDWVEDAKNKATAYNAYGVDLSGQQQYEKSLLYGKKAVEVIVNALKEHQDDVIRNFLICYQNLDNEKSIKDSRKKIRWLIHELVHRKEKSLIEKLFYVRGNIPWHLINQSKVDVKTWRYSINYGEITWIFRKYFYGELSGQEKQEYEKLVIISERNDCVYHVKYAEKILDGEIAYEGEVLKDLLKPQIIRLQNLLFQQGEKCERDEEKWNRFFEEKVEENLELEKIYDLSFKKKLFTSIWKNRVVKCPTQRSEKREKEYLEYSIFYGTDLMLEIGQYIGFSYFCTARYWKEIKENKQKAKKYIKKARKIANQVVLMRADMLGEKRRKTVESLYYSLLYDKYRADMKSEECDFKELENKANLMIRSMNEIYLSKGTREKYWNLYDEIKDFADYQKNK